MRTVPESLEWVEVCEKAGKENKTFLIYSYIQSKNKEFTCTVYGKIYKLNKWHKMGF